MIRGSAVRATVQVGEVETPYLRAGSGPALILLDRGRGVEEGDPLFRVLSTRGKVICPRVPDARSLTRWMLALLDGLGLDRPVVVLRGGLEDWDDVALRFLRECGEALGPVFLTGPGDAAADALAAILPHGAGGDAEEGD